MDPLSGDTSSKIDEVQSARSLVLPTRLLSCLLCAQRKVKCDKKQPCSNCTKAGIECIPGIASRAQRRARKNNSKVEDVTARCRRYERLLLSQGFKKEDLDAGLDINTIGKRDFKSLSLNEPSPASSNEASEVPANPSYGLNLWVSLSDEILDDSSEDDLLEEAPLDHIQDDSSSILLGFQGPGIKLELLQPQPVPTFQLWQAFVDNVNPLTKLVHIPTYQKHMLAAATNLSSLSKSVQAVLFNIYAAAINSLDEEECLTILGEPKHVAMPKYLLAAKHALISADLLNNVNMELAQAFALYLVCVRANYEVRAFCVLSAVAVRMCQRLGFHREDLLENLSVFNAELGRRLWWFVVLTEANSGNRAGVGTMVDPSTWSTRLPANINDSDLYAEMREPPQIHSGVTEMTSPLLRFEMAEFIRRDPVMKGNFKFLIDTDIPVAERERTVQRIQDDLRQKYVQLLDPLIPLHMLMDAMSRTFLSRLMLLVLHPRQYADRGASLPRAEKDKIFDICLDIIIRDNWAHEEPSMQRYRWHTKHHFQHDSLIYIVNELRSECMGARADLVWPQILLVIKHHSELVTLKKSLATAIGSLILKSWKAREDAYAALGQFPPEGSPPEEIAFLRKLRGKLFNGSTTSEAMPNDLTHTPATVSQIAISFAESMQDSDIPPLDSSALHTSPMNQDTEVVDWSFWNDLLQNAGAMEQQSML